MSILPEPDWKYLYEAGRWVLEETRAETVAVQKSMKSAFCAGRVRTRARCQPYFRRAGKVELPGGIWEHAVVNWGENMFGIPRAASLEDRLKKSFNGVRTPSMFVFEEVEVNWPDLERWFDAAQEKPDSTDAQAGPAEPDAMPEEDTGEDSRTDALEDVSDPKARPPDYPKTEVKRAQIEHRWDQAIEFAREDGGLPLVQIAMKIAEGEIGAKASDNPRVESRANTIRRQLGGLLKVRGWPRGGVPV